MLLGRLRKSRALTRMFVADLGCTRCDTAVVTSRGGMWCTVLYTIPAMTHNYALSGVKLDEVLVDHFSKEFFQKDKVDPENERSLATLILEPKGTNRLLSLGTSATISIVPLVDGNDFHSTINRLRYELSPKVFNQIAFLVEEIVKKAALDMLDITRFVIPSGGTSHPPKIASLIAKFSVRKCPSNTHSGTQYITTLGPWSSNPTFPNCQIQQGKTSSNLPTLQYP
ncbi:unnamed protein product [Tuber melanosporum]|uniref:(Perigord truffle) hypothetical protein n=1 Tax=Tuber melanosporum (strain Mel28) TaxID=656061 RepID=D5GI50_TUBMM|nr:uncharacterized protein GSTUM_00008277001 [Tuber melanosporum]CAZ84193.1 unnamed protein product [Tuber melanosporum]